jgi:hypothetical protein
MKRWPLLLARRRQFLVARVLFEWRWVFELRDFLQPSAKALRSFEARGEKGLGQFPSQGVTDQQAAKTDHVQIIVLNALMRRKIFINQASPNTDNFIRGKGRADPAATDAYASIHGPGGNRTGQGNDKVRVIIIRLQLPVAEVGDLVTSFAQFPGQKLL